MDASPAEEARGVRAEEPFGRLLNARAIRDKVPISGSIELTRACNLRCAHCYARTPARPAPKTHIAVWRTLRLLDEVADEGCLYLLLTGGEPLLHPAFRRIYVHAKRRGFLVTVFTNGTLIGPEEVALFRDWPPLAVDITLYGATPATCARVTGSKTAFARCIRGIERLRAAGVRVKLKTMLLGPTASEFARMEQLAREYGTSLRIDAGVFPRLDGDRSPLRLRLPADRAADIEMSDPLRREEWKRFYNRLKGPRSDDRLFACGAGTTAFHVNCKGRLQPCLMAPHIEVDLARVGFPGAWRSLAAEVAARRRAPGSKCARCGKGALCGLCPGFSAMETGDEQAVCEYQCALGMRRYAWISGRPGR